MEKTAKLRKMKIFKSFTEDELKEVSRVAIEKIFPSNGAIIEENKNSDGLFFISTGTVHVSKKMPTLSEMSSEVIAKLGPGDHFGEMSLIDGKPASASIIAAEATICFEIKTEDYRSLISENPPIALKLFQYFTKALCDRLRKTDTFLLEELMRNRKSAIDKTLLSGSI